MQSYHENQIVKMSCVLKTLHQLFTSGISTVSVVEEMLSGV